MAGTPAQRRTGSGGGSRPERERRAGDPTVLLGVVNEHVAAVVRAIASCGGVVEKFVGDGVLATFGAREEQADHRERALAAGLGAIGAKEALNRRRAAAWGFRLEMGVGIAGGRLVVGGLGPRERWEMGVLGDPINVAARLVARARAGDVVLTAEAYRGLARSVAAELVGPTLLRGRSGAVELMRIPLVRRPETAAAVPSPSFPERSSAPASVTRRSRRRAAPSRQ